MQLAPTSITITTALTVITPKQQIVLNLSIQVREEDRFRKEIELTNTDQIITWDLLW